MFFKKFRIEQFLILKCCESVILIFKKVNETSLLYSIPYRQRFCFNLSEVVDFVIIDCQHARILQFSCFSEVPSKLSEKDVMRTAEWFRCDNTKLSSRDNFSVKGKLSPIVCIVFIAMAIFLNSFLTSWLSFSILSNLTPR